MIYLIISEEKQNKYSLVEGLLELEVREGELLTDEQVSKVEIELIDTNDSDFGFKGTLPLGKGHVSEFFTWIEETLLHNFPTQRDDIEEMMVRLADAYSEQLKEFQSIEREEEPKTKGYHVKPKTKKKLPIKKGLIIGLSFFILISGSFIAKPYIPSFFSKSEKVDSFKQDLSQLSPEVLGNKYPDKLNEIATYYLKEKKFDLLKVFNQAHPTKEAAFDLAFHQEEWEKVIQADVNELSEERKVMLAFSYIQLNQLEEAKILNKQLKSNTLTKEIDLKIIEEGLTFIHQKKVKEASDLKESLATQDAKIAYQVYLDDAEVILQMVDLYAKKKEKDNEALWLRKLEEIGKVQTNEL